MVGKARGHSPGGTVKLDLETGGRAAEPKLILISQTYQVLPFLLAHERALSDKRSSSHMTIGGTAITSYSNSIRMIQVSCSCMSLHVGPHPATCSAVQLQHSLADSR